MSKTQELYEIVRAQESAPTRQAHLMDSMCDTLGLPRLHEVELKPKRCKADEVVVCPLCGAETEFTKWEG